MNSCVCGRKREMLWHLRHADTILRVDRQNILVIIQVTSKKTVSYFVWFSMSMSRASDSVVVRSHGTEEFRAKFSLCLSDVLPSLLLAFLLLHLLSYCLVFPAIFLCLCAVYAGSVRLHECVCVFLFRGEWVFAWPSSSRARSQRREARSLLPSAGRRRQTLCG